MWRRRISGMIWLVSLIGLLLGGCTVFKPTNAVIELSQLHGTVPLTITYNGGASEGRDGISTYLWSFGDGAEVHAVSGSHTFNHAGQYQVQLTVRAADGTAATTTSIVEVEPAFWVADENLNEIYKLDSSGNVLLTLPLAFSQPRGLALAERDGVWSLFVVCWGNGFQRLIEVDPDSGILLAEYAAPAQDPGGLTYAPNAPFRLWHVDRLSRKIYEINPADGQIFNVFGATYFQSAPHLIDSVFLHSPSGIAWRESSDEPGALWVLEAETRLLYELEIVAASDIMSGIQLAMQPDRISLSTDLFPISGFDWYGGFLWVLERDRHQLTQVDPTTGVPTGVVLKGFPGAAVSGLAIQK